MPRLPRVYIEGALYYITSEGNQNRNLFNDKVDYDNYLELLAKYKKEKGFKLFAFVLLPKHLHLLVELKGKVTISSIMHDLNSLYTKVYNSRYQRKGHLFQGRFKSIIIEKGPYLTQLIRYVHLNPKRAGLVSLPQDYPYSSHKLYMQDEATKDAAKNLKFPDIQNEIEEFFSFFEEADKQKAYEEYVSSVTEKESFETGRFIHRKAFVGSSEFVEGVKKKMEDSLKQEEEIRVRSAPYKVFIIVGTLIIIALGTTTFYFYSSNLETSKRFNLFMYEFSKNFQNFSFPLATTQKETVNLANLKNSEWEIRLTSKTSGEPTDDILFFKDGKVESSNLSANGFLASNYSTTVKEDGTVIWETLQTKEDGSTATWYGAWNKDAMKGILSRRTTQGEVMDYSFVSIRRR